MDFSKLDFSTSSSHNSTNTGPIGMFFTKKCNYFSQETRWNHPFLSQSQRKGCNCSLKLTSDFICRRLYVQKRKTLKILLIGSLLITKVIYCFFGDCNPISLYLMENRCKHCNIKVHSRT